MTKTMNEKSPRMSTYRWKKLQTATQLQLFHQAEKLEGLQQEENTLWYSVWPPLTLVRVPASGHTVRGVSETGPVINPRACAC